MHSVNSKDVLELIVLIFFACFLSSLMKQNLKMVCTL